MQEFPSNFTLEEMLKYGDLPKQLVDKVYAFIEEHETDLKRIEDLLDENANLEEEIEFLLDKNLDLNDTVLGLRDKIKKIKKMYGVNDDRN